MPSKEPGKINEIIYNHTTYHNGKYRHYPTITGLNDLLDEIICSNSTTDYIRITPFYVNEWINQQIEFEEYLFFIECRDWFDEDVLKNHIIECLNTPDIQRPLHDFRIGSILYPLCQKDNIASFQASLKIYQAFLKELLPIMMEIAKSEMELLPHHIPFGYFCFEVHSD